MTRLSVYTAVASLTCSLSAIAVLPLPMSVEEFPLPGYRDAAARLVATHITDHRVAVIHKAYDAREKFNDPSKFDRDDVLSFHGSDRWLTLPTTVYGDRSMYGRYLDGEVRYHLMRDGRTGPFRVNSFEPHWRNPKEYGRSFFSFPATKQFFIPHQSEVPGAATEVEFEGRPAIRFEVTGGRRGRTVVHLDRATYQFLQSEAEKSLDLGGQYLPVKQVHRVTYREAGGKRLPVRWEDYKVTASKPKMLQFTIDFTEYVPHTPTADEVSLEKQFGVKPLPYDPPPAGGSPTAAGGGSGRAGWLYAAAAGFALLTVGLLAARRRRRPVTGAR